MAGLSNLLCFMGRFSSGTLFRICRIRQTVLLTFPLVFISSVLSDTAVAPESLNYCLDGRHHKEKPSAESELYKQCSPWKDRSCCFHNTTYNAHHTSLYKFNFNHCQTVSALSEPCKRHFLQDLCFYECSPNMGPWIVSVDMKIRKERFYGMPLCQSDCDSWFEACREDYTCSDNWGRKFNWTESGNVCLEGSKCKTFKTVFGNAKDFCEKVWDDSWKVLPDDQPCMRLWFNSTNGNPNDKVAAYYVYNTNSVGKICASVLLTLIVILVPWLG